MTSRHGRGHASPRAGGIASRLHRCCGRALACLAALVPVIGMAAPPRPNVLVILADDQGYGDVSAYGAADVRTPHIDRLAAEGMLFTAMRANATVCSPSRAALLTGCHADRVGVPGVIRTDPDDSWGYLDPRRHTLADVLGAAGYDTALIGKWHLGLESPNTPTERGFAHFHGFLGDLMDSHTTHLRQGRNLMRLDARPIDPDGHATDLFSDWAVAYLRDRATSAARPFFLYLAYTAPHFPIEPPAEWLDRVRRRAPDMPEPRARTVAFVEHLDAGIGRVLAALDETGLTDDTVVVFTSDNGGSLAHGQSNEPWRGGKQDHYDGGLRVPFLVRWPAVVRPGSRTDHAGLVFDLHPTCVELAGARADDDLDAVSLAPVLRGGEIAGPRDLYFVRREGGLRYGGHAYEALIRGHWKLLRNDPFSPFELYHLADDPQERSNLAAAHPAKVAEVSAAIRRHVQRGGATPWQPPSP
ncbi:MAG: sulfatase [Planctomycetaceae bacterium]